MENTHLDTTPAVPPRPPGDRSPSTEQRPGSPGRPLPPSRSSPDSLPELRHLGEYRLLRRLGEGGMGAVYLGYDGRHDRQVALKVLNDNLAKDQNYIGRFFREAKSGILLNHPNIVRTYATGQDRLTNQHFLVLEYVDGPSAQTLLTQLGKLSVGDAIHIALHIARALEHAHSRNIVHRDIKPDNILITRSGVAKLGDLGLAKRTDEVSHLTKARQGFGTTAYMPYEQAINAKYVDGRCDIYALGATLYHLITGQVPFPGENHLEVVELKNRGVFRPASMVNPSVPRELDYILGRMLARYPRDRYQTASELIIDLERSRLAVAVPSFADPDLARRDPLLQACSSPGEPTRLDPASTPRPGQKTGPDTDPEPEWIVRYRNRAGRPFTTRLSSEEVIERLQEGTLPADAIARRPVDEAFQPLSCFEIFRPYLPAVEKEPVEEACAEQAAVVEEETGSNWWTFALLLGGAMAVAGVILVLISWLL